MQKKFYQVRTKSQKPGMQKVFELDPKNVDPLFWIEVEKPKPIKKTKNENNKTAKRKRSKTEN
jgi:hypothetical protein